ncbi:hypothetical protein MRB53_038847 [Persea americana]|nr:hypothetical protein MRB53_038847 [Persea americana]
MFSWSSSWINALITSQSCNTTQWHTQRSRWIVSHRMFLRCVLESNMAGGASPSRCRRLQYPHRLTFFQAEIGDYRISNAPSRVMLQLWHILLPSSESMQGVVAAQRILRITMFNLSCEKTLQYLPPGVRVALACLFQELQLCKKHQEDDLSRR